MAKVERQDQLVCTRLRLYLVMDSALSLQWLPWYLQHNRSSGRRGLLCRLRERHVCALAFIAWRLTADAATERPFETCRSCMQTNKIFDRFNSLAPRQA
jgi:hypothetical protein